MSTGAGDEWIWYALAAGLGFILLLALPSLRRTMSGRGRPADVVAVAFAMFLLAACTLGLLQIFR